MKESKALGKSASLTVKPSNHQAQSHYYPKRAIILGLGFFLLFYFALVLE